MADALSCPSEPVRPVAGSLFRHVAALPIEGAKRRKVVALLAAFHDGRLASVNAVELAKRLDLPPAKVGALLERLIADGYVVQTNQRKRPYRYRVVLELPDAADPRSRERVA